MANPKLKNGYTPVAHELLEALCLVGLNGAEFRVVLSIIRATFGWHRKEVELSLTDLRNTTGIARRTLIYSIQNLQSKNVIVVISLGAGLKNVYSVNKDYETWKIDEAHFSVLQNRMTSKAHYDTKGSKPTKKKASPKPKTDGEGMVLMKDLLRTMVNKQEGE